MARTVLGKNSAITLARRDMECVIILLVSSAEPGIFFPILVV